MGVKNLYLHNELVPRIVPTLQELVGGRTTEVLPTLKNIFLKGLHPWTPHKGIKMFVATRWLTSHPITVSCWEKNSELERHWEMIYEV